MRSIVLAVAGLSTMLISCGTASRPAISDISNADSLVRVQSRQVGDFYDLKSEYQDAILHEGEIGCSLFGKPSVMLSSRCIKTANPGGMIDWCVVQEYLFACRTQESDSRDRVKAIKRDDMTTSVKPKWKAINKPSAKHERGESDVYKQCIKEVNGRVPDEWCDRYK